MATIVFMGTPDFAAHTLAALLPHHTIIGVVTQPDRPAGRNQQLQQSPVKQLALAHHIPVLQPEKLRKADAIAELKQWQPDLYIVAAFGQILPQTVLDIPAYASINVHASLLPRWRGAAPIQAAIRAGDAESGVTIMKMDAGLDTGPMLSQRAVTLAADETGQSLHDKLAEIGAQLLLETLPQFLDGSIQAQAQASNGVTFAGQIEKSEGNLDWTQDALALERLIRAFTPWPGTYTFWEGQQLKVLKASVTAGNAPAGKVTRTATGVAIGTGNNLLRLHQVQLAGRKALPIEEFVKGYPQFLSATVRPVVG